MSRGMVVVGGGECGARAAQALREQGWQGPVTLVGAEELHPYERPPLSKSAMTAADAPVPTFIGAAGALAEAEVEVVLGVAATDIDLAERELVLADGRHLPYERLLLATGATARPLAVPGGDVAHLLRGFADALALRERLTPGAYIAVVGGGFIGLEVAASAAARGAAVTVVEMAPQLMGRVVPAAVAATIADRHAAAGIDLRCGTGVAGLADTGRGVELTLSTGETLLVDSVVAGVGAVPQTELAEKAGLAVENGVRTDELLTTSDPDVFAAGDCCSFPHAVYDGRRIRLESWRNAQDQGTAAARNMLGATHPFETVPWFWSDQHDLSLQIAGLPPLATAEVVRRRADGVEIVFGLDDDGRLLSASAVGVGNTVAKDIRLAEMLITRRATPDPDALADPTVTLKALLRRS